MIKLSKCKKITLFILLSVLSISFQSKSQVLYFDDFEFGPPFDTTLTPGWRLRPALTGANGLVDISNVTSCAGQFVARIGKSASAGGFTRNGLDLYLDNLSGLTNVDLTFRISSHNDETNPLDGLCLSNDGGATFSPVVFQFNPQSWCQSDCGEFPPIHLNQLAVLANKPFTNQYVIRFQQFDDDDFDCFNDCDGLYLDNVKVYVPSISYSTVPYTNDFEAPLGAEWSWEFADSTTVGITLPTRIRNQAWRTAGTGANSSAYKLELDKTCGSGIYTSSAVDLRLNFSNQTQGIDMIFDIYSHDEETNVNDGIYFSDNGGISFKKVYDFIPKSPSSWCQNDWGYFPALHIDKLAVDSGINPYSSTFVIRFQQAGDDDEDCFNDCDGLFIDNINIYPAPLTYSAFPFYETFESGTFGSSWSIELGDSTALPATNVCNKIDGLVDVYNGTGQGGSTHSARLGKSCAGNGYNNNVLDLHLNLANASSVFLTFWIRNANEEQDSLQDRIFFSNDGGVSFVPAFNYNWLALTPGTFVNEFVNLDSVVAVHGLSFTSTCVVRFQQYDNNDFDCFNDCDGYYLDNIGVTGTVGVSEINQYSNFSVSPNPVSDKLTLVLPDQSDLYSTLTVTNMLGQKIYQVGVFNSKKKVSFNVAQFPNGLYSITLSNNKGLITKRFLKQ